MPRERKEQHNYIEKVLSDFLGFSYVKRIKFAWFSDGIYDAIDRAKAMPVEGESYPKGFGSDVYRLVEKIVKPKEI